MSNVLVVVTHNAGMSVAEVTNLRRQMRQAGAGFKVTKNRLARLALEGTAFEGLSPLFTGPTGIGFSVDPVAAAKVIVAYAKANDKLSIVGGATGVGRPPLAAAASRASAPGRGSASAASG